MGFDVKIIKHVLKLRKKDKKKLEEEDSLIDLYRGALNLRNESLTFVHVLGVLQEWPEF